MDDQDVSNASDAKTRKKIGLAFIIIVNVAVVFIGLALFFVGFVLGGFAKQINIQYPATCIAEPSYTCSNATISSRGVLSVDISQESAGSYYKDVELACMNDSMLPIARLHDYSTLPLNGSPMIPNKIYHATSVQCYVGVDASSPKPLNLTSQTTFNGRLMMEYSEIQNITVAPAWQQIATIRLTTP